MWKGFVEYSEVGSWRSKCFLTEFVSEVDHQILPPPGQNLKTIFSCLSSSEVVRAGRHPPRRLAEYDSGKQKCRN